MTPNELADNIEDAAQKDVEVVYFHRRHASLIAAALRLAEADVAFQIGRSRQERRARLTDKFKALDAYCAARSSS